MCVHAICLSDQLTFIYYYYYYYYLFYFNFWWKIQGKTNFFSSFRYSILTECWAENPKERPSFQWICAAVKRLTKDQKVWRGLIRYLVKWYAVMPVMAFIKWFCDRYQAQHYQDPGKEKNISQKHFFHTQRAVIQLPSCCGILD